MKHVEIGVVFLAEAENQAAHSRPLSLSAIRLRSAAFTSENESTVSDFDKA
jgi:hypothetical protein